MSPGGVLDSCKDAKYPPMHPRSRIHIFPFTRWWLTSAISNHPTELWRRIIDYCIFFIMPASDKDLIKSVKDV